jgi:SAM-dependent methyltransferase
VAEWPKALQSIYRVLQPGGWVQLTEFNWPRAIIGEHTARLVNHYMHEKTGLWTPVTDGLPQLLLETGFHDIQIIERKFPVGGDTEIGISMKDNMNELMNGFRGAFNASYPLEEEEIHEMFEGIERELKDMQEEGKNFDVVYNSYIARKPNA